MHSVTDPAGSDSREYPSSAGTPIRVLTTRTLFLQGGEAYPEMASIIKDLPAHAGLMSVLGLRAWELEITAQVLWRANKARRVSITSLNFMNTCKLDASVLDYTHATAADSPVNRSERRVNFAESTNLTPSN